MLNTNTKHTIIVGAAHEQMQQLKDNAVHLIVTSPPYPMIEMWDEIMVRQNPEIGTALSAENGNLAFELMHRELDKVWTEAARILAPGGFACINIGDATRTINGDFALYPNHSRVIQAFARLGFSNLPNILWRKQTNAPNKFMGSGMLPAGAYVTLEHEWILIFRKGGKRVIKTEEGKLLRKQSAFFWEERNTWFSDLWDLKGTRQHVDNVESRKRSAAYPFEIPYRLINMYSLKGDTVLDPFLGTGTSTLAAITAQRNSIGIEIDPLFFDVIIGNLRETDTDSLNAVIYNRLLQHRLFIEERVSDPRKNDIRHFNQHLNLPVITSQETEMELSCVDQISVNDDGYTAATYQSVQDAITMLPAKEKRKTQQALFNIS